MLYYHSSRRIASFFPGLFYCWKLSPLEVILRSLHGKIQFAGWYLLLGVLAVWLFSRWVLPWLWPFFAAAAAAAILEPAVAGLCRRGVKRPLAAGICALLFLGGLGSVSWLLLGRLLTELTELLGRLPELLERLPQTLEKLRAALDGWTGPVPAGMEDWIDGAVRSVAQRLTAVPGALLERLLGVLSAAAAEAPNALLFAVTAVLGAYFISAGYPQLCRSAAAYLPERYLSKARSLRTLLRRTLGRWLRAQGILLLIMFGALGAAFLLLGVPYALLLALLTAVVDALPVLGAGTVLLPWAAGAMLGGDVPLGLGLLITYGAVTVLRSAIQAKLLGDQLGLSPLATLAAIYAGWTLWGVWGMLLCPVAAICVKQAMPEGFLRRLGAQ